MTPLDPRIETVVEALDEFAGRCAMAYGAPAFCCAWNNQPLCHACGQLASRMIAGLDALRSSPAPPDCPAPPTVTVSQPGDCHRMDIHEIAGEDAPPDDLVALVREYQDAMREWRDPEHVSPGRRLSKAENALLAWVAPAPAAPTEHALRSRPAPPDDELPMSERKWTSKDLVEAIQHGIATARMQWTCPHCERQSAPVAAPAPDTCSPDDYWIDQRHDAYRPETPAPDAMPECLNCGGMGETTHDILVGGTEHDTEQRDCEACKGTGRRQEAQP